MKKPLTNMRVLLLAALAATAYGDGHELTCDFACVGAVYGAVAEAEASAVGGTYKDGDMAVYAYTLYKGYTMGGGDAGAAWVGAVVQALASPDVCDNTGKRDEMVACFKEATAEDVTGVKDWLADTSQVSADEKAGYEFVIGALANQLAPGSLPANEWGGLNEDAFNAALKVYYIVGAFANTLNPIIAYSFADEVPTPGAACYAQLFTAIDYVEGTAGKQDLAYAIAMKGEKLFGADGLKNAACFGEGTTAVVAAGDVTRTDGTKLAVTDVASILTATDAGLAEAETAITAALEAASPSASDPSDASPAAALSALIATVALML